MNSLVTSNQLFSVFTKKGTKNKIFMCVLSDLTGSSVHVDCVLVTSESEVMTLLVH